MSYATHTAAAVLALGLGFTAGWQVQGWRQDSIRAEQADQARELRAQRERAADHAAEQHEQVRADLDAQFRVITREVERVVEKPVYRNVCLDADGLRALADAVGQPAAAAGEPAPAVPGADNAR